MLCLQVEPFTCYICTVCHLSKMKVLTPKVSLTHLINLSVNCDAPPEKGEESMEELVE